MSGLLYCEADMEYRTKEILETLKRLPEPEYLNQVLNVPLIVDSNDFLTIRPNEPENMAQTYITVKAEVFRRNNHKWLEWMIAI